LSTKKPLPFATPTLARLYLAQGHLDEAQAILESARRDGLSAPEVDEALRAGQDVRAELLRSLLERVQERRRR
jgi:hypothetical protein